MSSPQSTRTSGGPSQPGNKDAARRSASAVVSTTLVVQIGERHGMYLLGRSHASRPIGTRVRKTGILHQVGFEPEIPCHANGGLHRIVGDHARHYQHVVSRAPQRFLESGPDERAVGVLDDYRLTGERLGFRFELVPLLARPVGGARRQRIVADMVDRKAATAPRIQELGDVPFGLRMVARAVLCPGRVVDRFLYVDHHQCGALRTKPVHSHSIARVRVDFRRPTTNHHLLNDTRRPGCRTIPSTDRS